MQGIIVINSGDVPVKEPCRLSLKQKQQLLEDLSLQQQFPTDIHSAQEQIKLMRKYMKLKKQIDKSLKKKQSP